MSETRIEFYLNRMRATLDKIEDDEDLTEDEKVLVIELLQAELEDAEDTIK